MKEVTLWVHYRQDVVLMVEDDWEDPSSLSDFTPEQLEEMNPTTAELYDWKVWRERYNVDV